MNGLSAGKKIEIRDLNSSHLSGWIIPQVKAKPELSAPFIRLKLSPYLPGAQRLPYPHSLGEVTKVTNPPIPVSSPVDRRMLRKAKKIFSRRKGQGGSVDCEL